MIIGNRIFQKYFLIATSFILIFIVLGFVFNNYMMELMRPAKREFMPPIFIAKIVDRLNPNDKVKSLEELESWQNGPMGPKLTLVDDSGNCTYPKNCKINFDWAQVKKPTEAYEFVQVKNPNELERKPPRFGFFPPPGLPPMHELNESTVIKLNQGTPLYLVISAGDPPPMPPKGAFGPWFGLGSLLISLFLGIGASIAVIYNSMKKGVSDADRVISEIKSGNLKSRFQVTRRDEFGQAMQRFNTMADEIEKLVHGLKMSEQARTKVLQELAHDLRTPLASLKNLVETLHVSLEKLDSDTRTELFTLSLKEIDYFERLVEDLLFLAQLKEPEYEKDQSQFNLSETVLEVADDTLYFFAQKGKKLELKDKLRDQNLMFPGDPHPIKRLVRNAVENACSFARATVTVEIDKSESKMIQITISDDGPGFKNEEIHNFGQRSVSRKIGTDDSGRVSLGLGSVVIKTICDVYHGKVTAENRKDENGLVLGAILKIEIPNRV